MTTGEWKLLIVRRTLYCGVASLLALALAFGLEALSIHRFNAKLFGVGLDNIIYATLPDLAICTGTVVALRKYRLIFLSVVVSLIIGFINHRIARQVLWLLYPSDSTIGLGNLGQFIDQHYSMVYGLDAGALIGSFLASLLVALFCAALQRDWRALIGGFAGGFVASSMMFLVSIWTTETTDPTSSFVWVVIAICYFAYGAILSGSIALGEYVGVYFCQSQAA
ncbi:MAG: hypothetical protein DRI48_02980 [Chloroflexi bacterium]|nr:MAG: hypothetical protein DRI48_02980 [Chloroflexota bacterium]